MAESGGASARRRCRSTSPCSSAAGRPGPPAGRARRRAAGRARARRRERRGRPRASAEISRTFARSASSTVSTTAHAAAGGRGCRRRSRRGRRARSPSAPRRRQGAPDRQPVCEALRERHRVGANAVGLPGEERSAAADACLHLVEDQQRAVAPSASRGPGRASPGQRMHAGVSPRRGTRGRVRRAADSRRGADGRRPQRCVLRLELRRAARRGDAREKPRKRAPDGALLVANNRRPASSPATTPRPSAATPSPAAACAVLDTVDDGLLANVRELSALLSAGLAAFGDVRGLGLLLAVELDPPRARWSRPRSSAGL